MFVVCIKIERTTSEIIKIFKSTLLCTFIYYMLTSSSFGIPKAILRFDSQIIIEIWFWIVHYWKHLYLNCKTDTLSDVINNHFRGNLRYNFEVTRLIPNQCQVHCRYSRNICSINGLIQLKKSLISGSPLIKMCIVK